MNARLIALRGLMVLLALIAAGCAGAPSATEGEPAPPTDADLYDVEFIDNMGWVVGSHGTVLFTRNRGDSWQTGTTNTTETLYAIDMVNPREGWTVGSGGVILKTVDGGVSWVREVTRSTETLHGVAILGDRGWAVGDRGTILHARRLGGMWEPAIVRAAEQDLLDIAFAPGSTVGWIAGRRGLILRTNDGGAVWISEVSGTTRDLYAVFARSPQDRWAVGDGVLLETGALGNVWMPRSAPTTGPMFDIVFRGVGCGWIATESGMVFQTTNRAQVWTPRPTRGESRINALFFSLASMPGQCAHVGYAVGNAGAIFRTIDGGMFWDRLGR
jgi:photosystem II stability/assembly factor-like uncharacterized protein